MRVLCLPNFKTDRKETKENKKVTEATFLESNAPHHIDRDKIEQDNLKESSNAIRTLLTPCFVHDHE